MSEAPTTWDFTDADITKATAKKELRACDEYFRFLITETKHAVGKEGSKIPNLMQINFTAQAMKDPDDPESTVRPAMYCNIPMPKPNPDVPGHVVPDWVPGLCGANIGPLFPEEVPGRPRKNKETGVLEVDGEEIDKADFDAYYTEHMQAVFGKAKAAYDAVLDPASEDTLVDRAFFAKVVVKDGYRNVDTFSMCAELPDGATLVAPELFLETAEPDTGGNGAVGRAKPAARKKAPAKKKAAKKKGRK